MEGARRFSPPCPPAAALKVERAKSTTTLKLSSKTAKFNKEKSERLRVKVSPEYTGVPVTGTVTVFASKTALCAITLKSGKGSCKLAAKALKAGKYRLEAEYSGSTVANGSKSKKEELTVVRP